MKIKFQSLFFLLFASCFLYQEANGQCSAVAAAPTGSITPSTLCQQGGTLIGSTAADATTLASGYARLYLLVDNATGIVVDNETTVAALTAPANATNADIIYSVYSLVYTLAEFGTADITNGTSTIIVGDANVITDNDGDPLLATPTVASCMDLSPAAATTVTVGKSLDFIYDNFYICGNTPANIDLSSDITGLQVTWTASSAGGVTGFTNQATPVTINALGTFDITDVLSNTSASPATVVYIVTPQLGSCFGNPISITQTVLPNLGIAITSTTCNGTDYNVAFAITGGSGGFTVYNDAGTVVYTPDNATGTVTGIPYGMLNLTLEDMEGCTSDVTNTTNSPQVVITSFTAGCAGGAGTGTLNTTATGAATLSYNIGAGSQTSGSFSGLADNIYTVTVTGGNGCSATSTATVSCTPTCSAVAAAPTGSITPSTLCQQGGTLTGSTAADATTLASGYARLYLLVNNANGVIVDNKTTVAALTAPANATNADITYSVYSLVYSLAEFGTADITNGTSTIIVGDANVITDNDGDPLLASPTVVSCMDLSPAAATTVTVGKSLDFIYDNFYICGNTPSNVDLSSDITGLQVTWTASSAGGVTGFTNQATPVTINALGTFDITDVLSNTSASPATVNYIVTPQLGSCFGNPITITQTILPNLSIDITSTTCNGTDYDIAFAITGGSGGFTVYNDAGTLNYTPDNATGTVTGIPFGTLNLGVDDVELCAATTATTINLPSDPLITVTNSTCTAACSPSGGSFTVTTACTNSTLTYYTDAAGTMGATTIPPVYAQSGPAQTIYYACVDLNACKSAIQTVTTVPGTCTTPTAGLTNDGPLTCSMTNVILTGSGGGTYAYSAGPTGIMSPGTYTVTVTSANGCTATATTTVAQDITTPTAGLTNDGPLTCSMTNVTLTGSGGGTYAYSAGPTGITSPGTYTVTVTSANGCTATATTEVTQDITTPTAGLTNDGPLTCSMTSVTLTGSGGGTYAYSAGPTGITTPGTYTVTVTSANGCTATATTEVTQDITTPTAGLTNDGPLTCSMTSVTLTGSGGGSYAYSAGPTGIMSPGTYTVTVTSANGCTATATTEVTQDITTPTAGLTNDGPLTCLMTNVTLTGSGGGTYAYSAGPTGITSPGTYTVTVTSANGCTATATTAVMQDITTPTAGLTNDGPLTCSMTSVTLTGSGGGTYAYSAGPSGITAPGTYTVTVTSANGCTATATTTVAQDITTPTAGLTNDGPLTCSMTSVTLTGSGGGTYAYSAGPTGITSPGTYTVTVTSANGCTATATTTVAQDITTPTAGLTNDGPLTCLMTNVTLTGSGGGTYAYSAGPTGIMSPGTYTVTVTSANGCTATATTTVAQDITTPTAGLTNDGPLTCSMTNVILTGSGGGTYAYSAGPTGIMSPGTYTVTVTSANGCTAIATTAVTQDITTPTAGLTNDGPLTCLMTSVTLTGSGGGTYAYSAGPSGITAPGTYTVTVTSANGCTATATTAVTQDITTPTAGLTNDGPLTCLMTNVTLTGSGGGTYAYSAGPTGITSPGTYTVTVTSANGCTATATTEVTQDITTPTAGLTNDGPLTCSMTNVTLTGSGGGTYAYSAGPTGITSPGTYTVTVTSANGCTATATTEVTQDITTPTAGLTNDGPLTCSMTNVTLTGSGGGSYAYSAGPTGIMSPGTYTVTVTSANGCTATATTAVTQDITTPTAGLTNDGPLTCSMTSVTLTGSGGGTYAYSAGPTGITSPGTYTVTVTSANGCTATATTTVAQDITTPTAGLTNDGPLTCLMTSVTLTGSGGGTYAYSAGPSGITAPGTYTVTVTSANGCTATATTAVTQDITTPTAGLTNDGPLTCLMTSVTLTGSGGGTYAYSAGPSGITAPGTYTVTVTSANGCTATATTAVTQDITTPTAGLTNDGPLTCSMTSVTLTGSGGGTYAYSAGPSGITAPGTYTVTVTSANGCTATATTEVTEDITTPTAGLTNDGPLTCLMTSVTLTGSGGGTYAYSAGPTNITTPGTYTVTVTSANGCTATATTEVTEDITTPTAGLTNDGPLTCLMTNVTLTGSGGGTYAYSAGPSGITAPGTYTVTVTSANGCTATATTTVAQDITTPTAGLTNDGPLTCLMTSVTLTGSGGGTYAYSAGPTNITAPGTYTVTVTSANGCTAIATTTVAQNITIPTVSVNPSTGMLGCTTTSISLTTIGTGTYVWNTNETTAGITVTTAGTYTVTITGTNGCTATATSVITGSTIPPIAVASNNGPVCEGSTINLSVNPNLPIGVTATYFWTGGAGTATTQNPSIKTMTPVKTGTYTVTVTYSNGCTATATTVLALNPKPTISSVVSNCAAGSATITVNATGTGLTYGIGGAPQTSNIFTSVANGTYTVTVTNSTGCTAKSTISVFCATCPIPLASNNGPVCAGGSINLMVAPNLPLGVTATYYWSGPGGTATIQNPTIANAAPNKAGTYTVTVTYSNGCTATASTIVTLSPSISGIILGPSSFCTGGSAVLTASGGGTYVWSTSATSAAITITTAGTYVVTITNGTGCRRISKTVTTTACKETDEFAQQQNLSVTPNPFAERATIEFMTNSTGHTNVKVYSMEGKEVAILYNANTQAGEIYQVTLDGTNLPSGMYFVEMTNANGKKMLIKAMISY